MRISVSGSQLQGKSTFIQDFIKRWPTYKVVGKNYRKLEGIKLNKEVTEESQWRILNTIAEEMTGLDKSAHVIFDRCTLDNIVYSLWANANNTISDAFIEKCIPIVRESMRNLDIVFFVPISKFNKIETVAKPQRETDITYKKEIDNIFNAIVTSWQAKGSSPFFVKDDAPAIIEIFGSPAERVAIASLYIGENGEIIGDDPEKSVLCDENLKLMETLLGIQHEVKESEDFEKTLRGNVKEFGEERLRQKNKKRHK